MKKIILLFLCCVAHVAAFSQAIPNAGFETWVNNTESSQTYSVPQGWITEDVIEKLDFPAYNQLSVTKSTQAYSGSFAVKMETVNFFGATPGTIFSVAGAAQLFGNSFPGFPYSARPANLQGYYKFTPVSNDTASVFVLMSKWNTTTSAQDIVGVGELLIGSATSTYTLFNIPISYASNVTPDTVLIVAGTGGANISNVGTVFYIDALSFSGTAPIGINELVENNNYSKLYPNPFNTNATITIDDKIKLNMASVIIYDVLGKEMKRINNITSNTITIEKGDMPNGIYFYKVINNETKITTGKFIVE